MNKKKLLALVLATLMSVSTTAVAFADEGIPVTTQHTSASTLSESKFPKILGAPLADHAYGGGQQDSSLAESYGLTAGYQGEDGVYYVTISAYNVKMHTNADHKLGYWVGLAVFAPEGEEVAKVKYSKSNSIDSGEVIDLETIGDRGEGIAYYVDAGSGTKEYDFTVQWFKEDGITNVGEPIKFHITLNVTLSKSVTVNNEAALNEALKKGGNIKVANDFSLSNPVEISMDGTVLDLNSQTLTLGAARGASALANHDAWINVTANNATIMNGTLETAADDGRYAVCSEQGGALTLNGVTIDSKTTASSAVANYGALTAVNSDITSAGSHAIAAGVGATTKVQGGSYTAGGNAAAVYGNDGATLTLDGGTFISTGNTAVDMRDNATLTVKEGTTLEVDDSASAGDIIKANSGTVKVDDTVVIDGPSGVTVSDVVDELKKNGITADVVDPSEDTDEDNRRSNDGGDYYGNEKWDKVKREIADAKDGDTIKVSATGLPYFPSSVARALKGQDITLEVRKNGETYSVNGLKIGSIDKIWYEFENLETELLTADEEKDETSSQSTDEDKTNPDTGR